MKCSSCRVRGPKRKFSWTHAELGAVKVKKKKQTTRNVQAYMCSLFSLFSLFSGKRKRKAHYSFFLFTAIRGPSLHWSGRNDRWVVGLGGLRASYLIRTFLADFPDSPMIKTSPSKVVRGGQGREVFRFHPGSES